MNRTVLTLSAASVAALSTTPSLLHAGASADPHEVWDGYVELEGSKVPIHLEFRAGFGETILGDIKMATGGAEPAALENVAIVGHTLYFNIRSAPGNPTFRGTISDDGLSVHGTYSQNGDHHQFEITYSQLPAVKPPEPPSKTATSGERWTGVVKDPSAPFAIDLVFQESADGSISGNASIPQQQVHNLPLEQFSIKGSQLSFAIAGMPGNPRFTGYIGDDGETVSGTFSQGDRSAPFELQYAPMTGGTRVAQEAPRRELESRASDTPMGSDTATTTVASDRWEGRIDLNGKPLAVQLDFFSRSDNSIVGDISVPSQGTKDQPLADVRIDGNQVSFGIQDVDGDPKFVGHIGTDGYTLSGTFTHYGISFPFTLGYVSPEAAPDSVASKPSEAAPATQPVTAGVEARVAATAESAPTSSGIGRQVGEMQADSLGLAPAPAAEPPPTSKQDHWEGKIETPGNALEIKLAFTANSDNTISGGIDIPAQNARNLPLRDVTIVGDKLSFAIKDVGGDPTFSGTIKSSTVTGTFTQGGASFPFTIHFVDDPDAKVVESLKGYVSWADEARKAWDAPGLAVAIVKDGKVLLSQGLGVRDLDSKAPITQDTLFAIGSCTKAFTTFVLGTLVDEGKLDWDKPVRTYMPSFRLSDTVAGEHLTTRDMVTHRSGLPRHDALWYNSTLTREEMVGRLAFLEPSKDLRQTWQYNNLMFLTAGYLAERVGGGTWEQLARDRVFKPLGMNGAVFTVQDMQASPDFAYPYEKREGAMRKMPFRDITQVGPAGSINASIADMAKWVQVHLENGKFAGQQIISPITLAELHRPQMIMPAESTEPEVINVGYAMGWFVSAYRGHLMIEHGGNIDGFSALVTLLPNEHMGVVALTNMNGSALPRLSTYHALDRLLGGETKDWNAASLAKRTASEAMDKASKANKHAARKEGTTPSHPIADFVGEYEHPGYGVVSVQSAGGGLAVTYNRISAPLEHWHYDTFVCGKNEADPALEDQQLLFRSNTAGDIAAVEITMDPTVKPIVFERKAEARLTDATYLNKFVGEYELGPQTIKVSLKGSTLVATVAGQPPYDLAPTRDDTFELKGLTGFSVKFLNNGEQAQFNQPNGVFVAKRK